jgi:signal transduction histidine kinase
MLTSIRHKLFAALAGFTVLLCVAYTGLALIISYVTEDAVIDRLLEREAAAITAQRQPGGDDLVAVYDRVDALPAVVRERVAAGRTRGEIFTDTGQHYHLRTLDLPAGRRYLLADVGPILVVSKLFQQVGGFLVAVALGLVTVALLVAWWLSWRLVAPLQVLADEVRHLGAASPAAFSASGRRDEIGYLAQKLATTFDDLQGALRREHAFTRDVSHELRTPLTVMTNTLAQADRRPLDDRQMAELRASVADIGKTVEVLFALARAEHIAHEPFDLRGCIEDSLLRLLDSDSAEKRLTLDLPDRLPVAGNRHLATLLLNNCLGNALFHGGAEAQLRVAWTDGVLSVVNTVDPTRAATMQGFQHGQNLLRRIADAMRWRIAFHADGHRYRVDIAPSPEH